MQQTDTTVPTVKSLLTATAIAMLLALTILITAILPAEFAIDPTGIGHKLGLIELAQASENQQPQVLSCAKELTAWTDITAITIPAHKGLEYKFHLSKDARFDYAWNSNGPALYFDFHGEPQGDTTGYFKSYQETTGNQANGQLIAPFEGSHGWYWENKSATPVTVMLSTKGDYTVLGLR